MGRRTQRKHVHTITKKTISLLSADIPEYLELNFVNNAINIQPKSLSMTFYEHIEEPSKTWVELMIGGNKAISFAHETESCTVKKMLEKVGILVSEDGLIAQVVTTPEPILFKIRIKEYPGKDLPTNSHECFCGLKGSGTSEDIDEDKKVENKPISESVALPSLLRPGFVVQCDACNKMSDNHVSCDFCSHIFKKPVESIPKVKESHVDETKNPITKTTLKEYKVQDFIEDFNTKESQINLRQKHQEKNSELMFKISQTKDELKKLQDRCYELQSKNSVLSS